MPSGCSQPLTSTIAPTTIGPSSTSMTVCAVTLTSLPPTFQTPMRPPAPPGNALTVPKNSSEGSEAPEPGLLSICAAMRVPVTSNAPSTSTVTPTAKAPFSASSSVAAVTTTERPATCHVPMRPLAGSASIVPTISTSSGSGCGAGAPPLCNSILLATMTPFASGNPSTSTIAPTAKPPFSCSRLVVLTTCTVLPATCQVPSNPLAGRLSIAPVNSPSSSPPPGGGGGPPTPILTSISSASIDPSACAVPWTSTTAPTPI